MLLWRLRCQASDCLCGGGSVRSLDHNRAKQEGTCFGYALTPECQMQCLEIAGHVDLDVLIPVLVSCLQRGAQTTHRSLLPMD